MQVLSIVFDLDGTLVDTAPDLMLAANFALTQAGHQPIGHHVLRPAMSYGARRMIESGLSSQGLSLSDDAVDHLTAVLLDYYKLHVVVDSRPYPGVAVGLEALHRQDVSMSICTNKLELLSRRLLGGLGFEHLFAAICGRDTFPVSKPHPDHLLHTLSAAGGDRKVAVMVGDSDVDIATAKAANVPIIGVSYGYFDQSLADAGADIVVDRFDDLPLALAQLGFGGYLQSTR